MKKKRKRAGNDGTPGILQLKTTGLLCIFIISHSIISAVATTSELTSDVVYKSCAASTDPVYNVTANEWIDEKCEMRYLTLFRIHVLLEYDIHKLSILNQTGSGADDIRFLYTQHPSAVMTALNSSMRSLSNITFNNTFSRFGFIISETSMHVDDVSLRFPSDGDRYNPPIIVSGYLRIDILPETYDFVNITTYEPEEILQGMLQIGAEVRLPVVLLCPAGHNQTIASYPPAGIIFGDGSTYFIGKPLIWNTVNYEGSAILNKNAILAMIAENRVEYDDAMVVIDVIFDFRNVTFLTTGETSFSVIINISAGIFRLVVDTTIQEWFSKYLHLRYINADFIRLLLGTGLLTRDRVDAYIETLNKTFQTSIRGTFPDIAGLENSLDVFGLYDSFDIRYMNDTPPIRILLNSSFSYLYKPTQNQTTIDSGTRGISGIKLFSIERTFVSTLPGPTAAGYNFIGKGMLNYTFRTPRDVIIYDVTAGGKRIPAVKRNGCYMFTVQFKSSDGNKSLRITFGADIEYNLEQLLPYFLLILMLIAVWIALWVVGRRKARTEKKEKKEMLDRGELPEDDEEEVS